MSVYTPAEAAEMLKEAAEGQKLFCIVVTGPDLDEAERLAVGWFEGYGRPTSEPITCGGSVVVIDEMGAELENAFSILDSDFFEDLIAAGMLPEDAAPCSAFAQAAAEAVRRNLYGLKQFRRHEGGCEIVGLAGYVTTVKRLLFQLKKQPEAANELPSNPTTEAQTCEKATRRNGDKSEKWLRLLVESYRSELLEEARNRGITLADSKKRGITFTDGDVDYYLATLVFCKSAKELSGMVADLPPTNGEKPPQRLTIKAARNILYKEWEPYREQRNKKLIVGVNSIAEALDSGLSERSNRSSYVPAKTPAERLEDLETARLEKEADEFMKRTPKV